jgi:FPC/CPF motif-containing protein YcgG
LPEDSWEREAYEEVKEILLASKPEAKKFPCPYATAGYKNDEQRFLFMYSEDVTEPRNIRLLANAMRAYFPISHELGNNTSLVIIHPTSDAKNTPSDYQQKFWDLLRGLRTRDLKNWPEEFPQDTNDPRWAFCFDGVPWFPAVLTPAHVKRHSRYAPNFTIAMQPKWVFDHLFRTPERRRAAVESVRKILEPFDDIEVSPDLSAYGTEGTTESHQYYLLDDNVTAECPYQNLDG